MSGLLRRAARIGLAALMLVAIARADDTRVPRGVLAWPAGPVEVRVALDEPVETSEVASLVGETIRFPGHDAYRDGADRDSTAFALGIAGASIIDEGRTLVLATDPHPLATTYSLPMARPGDAPLSYDLNGVEAAWFAGADGDVSGEPVWSGWWPSLDPRSARAVTSGSVSHEQGFQWIDSGPGTLTLRTLVMLPGDAASVTIRLDADRPFGVTLGFETGSSEATPEGTHRAEVTAEVFPGQPAELNVLIPPTDVEIDPTPSLHAWRIEGDEAIVLGRDQTALPWAPMAPPLSDELPPPPFDLAGGDPARGREVFRSAVAKCADCHKMGGEGGEVGPALDKLAGTDAARIYRDLADPSASILPDYVTYTVALNDGRVVVGVVRAEGVDALRVLDTDAKATVVARAEVEDLLPSGTSVMPVGLAGALGEERVRDLIAYLRSPKEAVDDRR